jgi:hypothetical protein
MQDEVSSISSGAPAADAEAALRLGPFRVSTAREEIEAFQRETGWLEINDAAQPIQVPHTFPMRWLTLPELRTVFEAELKKTGGVAFHESQSFTYESPLDADQDYLMTTDVAHQKNPERLVARTYVVTTRDEPRLQMETILRIITAAVAAP